MVEIVHKWLAFIVVFSIKLYIIVGILPNNSRVYSVFRQKNIFSNSKTEW